MAKVRRVVQVIFLLFFVFLFIRARYPYEVSIPSDLFLRFSPLTPLFYFIDSFHIPFFLWPGILILLLTPFLGRFFCGWICPLGTSLDAVSHLIGSPSNQISQKWIRLRWLKFGLLAGFVLLAIFSVNLWGYLDPLSIFTRITTVIFHPILIFFLDKFLLAGAKVSFLEPVSFTIYDWFKTMIMPEAKIFLAGVFWVSVLVIVVFGLEKLSRRFWCRYVCPAGALLGLLSQFRFYERLVGESCPICNRCQTECKMNAIPAGNVKETNKVECIECFNCGEECPPKVKAITYRFRLKPYYSRPDFSRRQFLVSSFSGVVTLGLLSVGIPGKSESSRKIRPPGALPENEFLDRCIRCLECVRICESNGACLQPAGLSQKLEDLWTPVAIMRYGYCEYGCNLCGQVCPTDAILPLPLEVKQKTAMGLAYFDKNLCIPYERHEDCIVCEEHCPTPDKAIKFDRREATLPDGTKRMVKYPYVVRELCIGCGICETKCPLPGEPGVFVTRENEKRLEKMPEQEPPA
ncbi:MAG: 4Fe-4S binding protein [Calditrichia bacterium]